MSAPDGFRHWYKKRDELAEAQEEADRRTREVEACYTVQRDLKARMAEAKGLLEEIGDEWPAVRRTTVERAYALIARPADSAPAAPWTSGLLGYPCPACGITLTADHDCTAETVDGVKP